MNTTKTALNQKLVRSTGISFALVGTVMHGLNIVHMTNATMSQTWSVIAIIGFLFTMTTFAQRGLVFFHFSLPKVMHPEYIENCKKPAQEKNDVSLP